MNKDGGPGNFPQCSQSLLPGKFFVHVDRRMGAAGTSWEYQGNLTSQPTALPLNIDRDFFDHGSELDTRAGFSLKRRVILFSDY